MDVGAILSRLAVATVGELVLVACVATAVVATFTVATVWLSRVGAARVAGGVAVAIGIGTATEGMWSASRHLPRIGQSEAVHLLWRALPATLFESAMVACAALAFQHADRDPRRRMGAYGVALWIFATLSGLISSLAAETFFEWAFRLVAPIVAAGVLVMIKLRPGLAGAGAPGWIGQLYRRTMVRLGLMTGDARDVPQLNRAHLVRRLTKVGADFAAAPEGERRERLRAKLNRLALAADEDAVIFAAAANVHRARQAAELIAATPVATPDLVAPVAMPEPVAVVATDDLVAPVATPSVAPAVADVVDAELVATPRHRDTAPRALSSAAQRYRDTAAEHPGWSARRIAEHLGEPVTAGSLRKIQRALKGA